MYTDLVHITILGKQLSALKWMIPENKNFIELDDPALQMWLLHAYLICVSFCRTSVLYICVEVFGTKETWKGIMQGEIGIA